MSGSELEIARDPAKAKANLTKHGVSFSQAATVLTDRLALTVFDAAHSRDAERWFTLGTSADGRLLAVAHTLRQISLQTALVPIISAREASRQERPQYQSRPR